MRRVLMLACAIACVPIAARADEMPPPEPKPPLLAGASERSLAAARHWLALKQEDEVILASLSSWRTAALRRMLQDKKTSPEKAESFVDGYLMPALRDRVPELIDMEAEVFATRFTAEEIGQIEAFLSTDVGRKFIGLQADLVKELTTAQYLWQERIMKEARDSYQRDLSTPSHAPTIPN